MEGISMDESKYLTILQMNDTHGYYDLHTEMFLENGKEQYRNAGGYARIAKLFKEARKKNPDGVLAFDNGDTFHGTYPVTETKGEILVPVMNALKFDAMTSHWEFAYGPGHLQKLTSKLAYPMLACNIYSKKTNELAFLSHIITERKGLRIGVIGVAEHIVDKMMPAHFSAGVYFTLGTDEVQTIVKQLRKENAVDLIVVLSHFGFPQDVKLAEETEGLDVLLSSHTHNSLNEPVVINETIIIQSGCHGAHIGKLDVEVAEGKITDYKHELIEVSEKIPPVAEVQKMIDKAIEPYRKSLNTVIGRTRTDLNRYYRLESTIDNLLLHALMNNADTEVAFSNGWRYGAPIPAGPINMNDVWNINPTNPPVSTVYMSGREMLEMLEENLENTFSADPYNQMGGYLKRC